MSLYKKQYFREFVDVVCAHLSVKYAHLNVNISWYFSFDIWCENVRGKSALPGIYCTVQKFAGWGKFGKFTCMTVW